TRDAALWQSMDGVESLPLHSFGSERVAMLRLAAAQQHCLESDPGGIEIFVVDGRLRCNEQLLPADSWLRLPAHEPVDLLAESASLLWLKRGHLPG
ncbi:MAG: cupin domain-containing protein, partial [Woeseiaceae bacterium]|nr:cupin domain-containing protein [Woeseiaceae bacterium]